MPSSKLLADVIGEWGACAERCDPASAGRRENYQHQRSARAGSDSLARTIEGEVIPRLMLAHGPLQRGEMARGMERRHPSAEDVTELTRLVLEHDSSVATTYVDTLRNRGVPTEYIYVELLAPVARLLGEMWKADLCDFADVTIGLSRLQHILHEMSPAFMDGELPEMTGLKVMLLPLPGEQHTFGIMMVEEYFRRAGWECCTAMPQKTQELTAIVKREHFDVVGISVSGEAMLDRVETVIKAIRKASPNKGLTVLVGGHLFLSRPDLVPRVGADGTAADGRTAVLQLRSVFDTNRKRIS